MPETTHVAGIDDESKKGFLEFWRWAEPAERFWASSRSDTLDLHLFRHSAETFRKRKRHGKFPYVRSRSAWIGDRIRAVPDEYLFRGLVFEPRTGSGVGWRHWLGQRTFSRFTIRPLSGLPSVCWELRRADFKKTGDWRRQWALHRFIPCGSCGERRRMGGPPGPPAKPFQNSKWRRVGQSSGRSTGGDDKSRKENGVWVSDPC